MLPRLVSAVETCAANKALVAAVAFRTTRSSRRKSPRVGRKARRFFLGLSLMAGHLDGTGDPVRSVRVGACGGRGAEAAGRSSARRVGPVPFGGPGRSSEPTRFVGATSTPH